MTTLWGGRFSTKLNEQAWALNTSLLVDQRMAIQDVDGSLAWAGAIYSAGVLDKDEHARIVQGHREHRRFRRDAHGATGPFHLSTEECENLQHVMRVAQIGDTVHHAFLLSEQRRGQDRQRRILGTAHLDRTGKRVTTVNANLIHTWQTETVSPLNNRFWNKCRGIFFPPTSKEALRSDRARSPAPKYRPD